MPHSREQLAEAKEQWRKDHPRRFEYQLVDLRSLTEAVAKLNTLGQDGWELAATWGNIGELGILKREII